MYTTNCITCTNQFSYRINRARKFCSKKCLATHYNSRQSYDYARDANLKHAFGLTLDQYNKMAQDQQDTCAICKEPETGTTGRWDKKLCLAVDHDHKTEKNRGLLCRRCNQVLGQFGDDIDLFKKAIAYLEKHK